jgi:Protein of unknown function (DUF416)
MRRESLKSLDDYERWLGVTVKTWSPAQRTAFAAAMAERWLPVYEAFAAAERWGDPAHLRRSIEAAWNHARGQTLAPAELARHNAQLRDCTPHMDDFEAPEALAACVILSEALECCRPGDNLTATVRAALSGFEAAVPDWVFDPEEQPRLWQQVAARSELRKQLKLVEQIEGLDLLDDRAAGKLRRKLTSTELVGVAAPPATAPSGPPTITNQQAFTQYRSMIEADLRNPSPLDLPGVNGALLRIGAWAARYSRRRQTIDGSYGQLTDALAQAALVARQRAHDAAENEPPTWGSEEGRMIELRLANPYNEYDARSSLEPHGYGPSLRRLWVAAKRAGRSDAEAWDSIAAWARHRPPAWSVEDQRKKKGWAYASPALGDHLARPLTWVATGDVDYPWSVEVEGSSWRVRLNDFPDDFMYSLVIDESEIGSFHDWPETWQRA